MQPITATPLPSKGIVVYFPDIPRIPSYFLKLDIYFSPSNPLFHWVQCDNTSKLLWTTTTSKDRKGILFVYQTQADLPRGFYTLAATLMSNEQSKKGTLTVGLPLPEAFLAVGVPYSTFPSITLT